VEGGIHHKEVRTEAGILIHVFNNLHGHSSMARKEGGNATWGTRERS
jgi:hypothetical protein